MINPTSKISNKASIHPTAIIGPHVVIEEGVEIGPFCLIGLDPENKKSKENKGVIIRKGARLFGHCTVDGGTLEKTVIGEGVWMMKGAHVGHDASIGDNSILACHSAIGGHTLLGAYCNIALNSSVHQKMAIPTGVMLGMNSCLTKKADLKAFQIWAGVPAKYIKENLVLRERLKI